MEYSPLNITDEIGTRTVQYMGKKYIEQNKEFNKAPEFFECGCTKLTIHLSSL